MLFFISATEYSNIQQNTTKVNVHLRGGIAQVLDQHQDLMGLVEDDIVEVETFFENRVEKLSFAVQNGVFIISNKGLGADREKNKTAVYVYAKRVQELNAKLSVEATLKEYEKVSKEVEILRKKLALDDKNSALKAETLLAEDDAKFLLRLMAIIKKLKG